MLLKVYTQRPIKTIHHSRAHYEQRPFSESVFVDRIPGVDRDCMSAFLENALVKCQYPRADRPTEEDIAKKRAKLGDNRVNYEYAIDELDKDFKERPPWFVCDFSCNWLSCLMLIN